MGYSCDSCNDNEGTMIFREDPFICGSLAMCVGYDIANCDCLCEDCLEDKLIELEEREKGN